MRKGIGLALAFGVIVGVSVPASAATSVTVSATATTTDNYYDLYLADGGVTSLVTVGSPGSWQSAEIVNSSPLPLTVSVIAVEAWNLVPPPPSSSNPAAFLGSFTTSSGVIRTDGTWKVYVVPTGGTPPTGWNTAGYDDSAWTPATVIAQNGSSTQVGGGSNIWYAANGGPIAGIDNSAWWIWSDDNGRTNTDGAVDQHVLLRYDVVPEPLTMISGFLAISGLGVFIRRHMRVKARA
jgi:hypothetical protein